MSDDADPPRYEIAGLSLRLRHPDARDLDALLRRWSLDPTRSWRAGEARATPKGNLLGGIHRESYAATRLPLSDSSTLADALAAIMSTLAPLKPELAAFTDDGGKIELFVSWFFEANGGDTLDWRLLAALAECQIDLALDIYPNPPRSDDTHFMPAAEPALGG